MLMALTSALVVSVAGPAVSAAGPAASAAKDPKMPKAVMRIIVLVGFDDRKTTYLACGPDGGGEHPRPHAACKKLRSVKGDFAKLVKRGVRCPGDHMPHQVTITGTWRGKPIKFSKVYENSCEMRAAGGALFRF
ncbi:hypothetical protein GCM10009560_03320 [Nonomuraea longicatena]|uniref:Subtilisin inhibitor domain-containing protein n=2 Tax=Nonomuraea longicatena TaxID=83682 RepID=A0ABN1NNN6_9ACTN